ncbi:biosynthetic-type acetolactate synthase large subunit [Dictyoglomus thermophilum]|uniref:Acetolactate synthase n=2 Tax=Dictyoglomus thermophilum TaxID=14 RepID=B5YEF1_DICT6|nr:biosynthetic-type acetolactate synthase large subunit [Dictyoglomus thermophilum]ACI19136.1 acetolactate synthase, large subunit, biosynthetic type [Dictyoglomus thermophilum H-6-12]MCX7721057.1 biosynthetic-type acetolactate synthase large subunit [Dictyoglomus thermophilum]TYT22513.1 biosynthetic-type acetolactate synthase large subunit [Dictyoglomus thermophilum]
MLMTVAEAIIKYMQEEEGIEVIFGYPGGAVIGFYDALYNSSLKHVLVRHEQGAAHAADGYARSTGKVGVCVATSGPGATNLTTGIATAYMDSVPIVAITGQVKTSAIGKDSFQEVDTRGITMPITKHNYLITDPHEALRIVKEAFYIAKTGRKGPVLIDIPSDIFLSKIEYSVPSKVELLGYKPNYEPHPLQIKRAAQLIKESEKPIILAGGGVIASEASQELIKFAERINAPVVTTLMGKGAIPETHELSCGFIGMHGAAYANYAINDSDLIIAIGVRFSDRSTGKVETFAPNAKIIHIDIDPAEIGKNVQPYVPIVADAKRALEKLIEVVEPKTNPIWWEKIKDWKNKYPLRYRMSNEVIKPQYVIERIYELTKGEAIVVTEVGQNQMWAAQYYKVKRPRQFITSGGLGTMGFGFPAAIGAQIGNKDKVVIDIAGDGSIQMNIQELATAASEKLPVKIFILNNSCLGMVRQWQELFYERRYSCTLLDVAPDFEKLAEAYGAYGRRVEKIEELDEAIEWALNINDSPVIVDIKVNREENVFPMIPAGGSIDKMLID